MLASAILPGSGTIAAGFPLKGMTSLIVNALCIYSVYWLISSHLYIGAIVWGSIFISKFYRGNIILTKKMLQYKHTKNKNALIKNLQYSLLKITQKYPISYQHFDLDNTF